MNLPTPIVSTEWLREHFGEPGLKIIDASWRLDGGANPARTAYDDTHIPGAVFFDIDTIADNASPLPHMAPSPQQFVKAVVALGLKSTDKLIIYDEVGLMSAARVWWTFLTMGHDAVAVLDGGLPKWITEGGVTTNKPETPAPGNYHARSRKKLIASAEDVRNAKDAIVLDARPADRFKGLAPEPRTGLRSGAMPEARNIPAADLLNDNKTMKSPDALIEIFAAAGFQTQPVITTCGSGVTAAVIALALTRLGHRDWRLYDGSWAEWGQESNDPEQFPVVATGPETVHDTKN